MYKQHLRGGDPGGGNTSIINIRGGNTSIINIRGGDPGGPPHRRDGLRGAIITHILV